MSQMKTYLLSLIAATIICSIISGFIKKDSAYGSIIKLICGMFLLTTAIAPIIDIRVDNFNELLGQIHLSADNIIEDSEAVAIKEASDIIKSQLEAYILDKASMLGLQVKVKVTLNDSDPPSPYSIEIKGAVSPYLKNKLKQIILEDLSIPEERQIWT